MTLLYEADVRDVAVDVVLDELIIDPDPYTDAVVRGVGEHRADLDALIEAASENWRLARMPTIDRAVLRLATFELVHRPDVPLGAVIDEAVELAKRFSTDDSGRFVNGILSRVADEVRPRS